MYQNLQHVYETPSVCYLNGTELGCTLINCGAYWLQYKVCSSSSLSSIYRTVWEYITIVLVFLMIVVQVCLLMSTLHCRVEEWNNKAILVSQTLHID